MVFVSLPEITCWGNPYSRLPGAHRLSPRHGGGLPTHFLFGRWVAYIPDHPVQRAGTVPFFAYLVQRDSPAQSRFLVRSQLLTR
jgi:hypothetical protein